MYSQDLRERLVRCVDGGMSRRAAAAVFGVSPSTAIDWVSRWWSTGTISPRGVGGDRRSHVIEAERNWLLATVSETPDMTLEEIRTALCGRGLSVGHGTVWRFFERHGISFKKNRAGQRTGSAGRRRRARKAAAKSAQL